jgi:ankyrin repeat protein
MNNPSLPETPNKTLNKILLTSNHINRLSDQIEDEKQNAELFSATFEDDEDTVKYFLAQRANPSSTNNSRTDSYLHAATQNGHEIVIRIFLEHNANTSSRTFKNWTVLHSAFLNGGEGIIRLLIDHGAAVSVKLSTEETSSHITIL